MSKIQDDVTHGRYKEGNKMSVPKTLNEGWHGPLDITRKNMDSGVDNYRLKKMDGNIDDLKEKINGEQQQIDDLHDEYLRRSQAY